MSAPIRASAGQVAAAALLPPLGVHLAGRPPRDFWMASGLTLLGFVPGAVYALVMVLRRVGSKEGNGR